MQDSNWQIRSQVRAGEYQILGLALNLLVLKHTLKHLNFSHGNTGISR